MDKSIKLHKIDKAKVFTEAKVLGDDKLYLAVGPTCLFVVDSTLEPVDIIRRNVNSETNGLLLDCESMDQLLDAVFLICKAIDMGLCSTEFIELI